MTLKTLLEWIKIAKGLGYKGKAAVKFAEAERYLEIELLDKDRAHQKAEAERNAELANITTDKELAKITADKDRELAKLATEAELAKISANREIELAKLQMADSHDALSVSSNTPSDRIKPVYNSPQLPKFDQTTDDIDSYIRRFERFAEASNWDRTDWATCLNALLTGKALATASRLDAEEASDYYLLKTALLKAYDFTGEGFRKKFRTARIEKGKPILCMRQG